MSEWDDLGAAVGTAADTGWDDLGAPVASHAAPAPMDAAAIRRASHPSVANPFGDAGPGTGSLDPDKLTPGQAADSSFDDLGLPVGMPAAPGRVAGDARPLSTAYRGDGTAYQAGLAIRPAMGQDAPYVATGATVVPGQGRFGAVAASFARGAITGTTDAVAGAIRGAGYLANEAGRAELGAMEYQAPPPSGEMASDRLASRISKAGTDAADNALPLDSKYADSTWVKTSGMIGGALPYLAAAAVSGPAAPISAAAAGAAGTYESIYQDATAHGSTSDKAHEQALLPALIGGGLMSVNAGVIMKGLPWTAQQGLTRAIVDTAAASGTMVGVSEMQKLANNFNARQTYDPHRSLMEGVGDDLAAEALSGGLLHAGVHARGAVSGALDRLTAPVAAPELRAGAAGMTEAAALANERTANTAAPMPDAAPGNANDPGGNRPIPPPVDPNTGGQPTPPGNDNLTQGTPREQPYTTQPSTSLTPDGLPANANRPGGQFSDEQRSALAGLGYSPADIAAMPPDAAGRVIEQGLDLPQPVPAAPPAPPAPARPAQAQREAPARDLLPDSSVPLTGNTFKERAGPVVSRLMGDLYLTRDQASAIAGNLGHESEGLTAGIQERKPTSGRGGLGWAQWTGPRRVAFEKFAAERGLSTSDPEANYGFLVRELQGAESKALDALRGTSGLDAATRVFTERFERPGVVAMDSRLKFARIAAGDLPASGGAGKPDAGISSADTKAPTEAALSAPAADPVGRALADQVAASMEGTQPVYTNSGTRIDVRPEVVELSSLTASHDQDGRINPAFPHAEGVQPRDRSSAASQAQIQDIASGLVPERLAPSPDAGSGAPIVSPDGVVESGNGRALALGRVYGDPGLTAQAASYKDFLGKQGYDVAGMDQPVLVSRRVTEMDDAARGTFARDANERSTLAMSGAEQARADAPRASGIMGLWSGSDPAGAGNTPFVRAFMARLSPEEAGAMRLKDGALSPEGARRIQAAVTASAYGDAMGPVLDRAMNGNSEGMRGALGGLTDAAGAWAGMRQAAAEGRVPASLDITPAVAEAVNTIALARSLERPVREVAMQSDLDRPPLSPEGRAVLGMMFNNPAMTQPTGAARVANRLRTYAEEAAKASPGPDMFGTPPPKAMDVLATAIRLDKQANERPTSQRAMLARRDAAQAHAATMRDSGALTLTPDALAARDRLRTGAQAMMRFSGLPPEAGLKLVDRLLQGGADGSYSRGLVTLAFDTHPDALPAKMFHETVHGLLDPQMGALTKGQRDTLLAGADRWLPQAPRDPKVAAKFATNREAIEANYGKDPALVREEGVARMGEEALRDGLMRQKPAAVVYGKLLNTVRGLGNMLRGQGYRTSDDVFRSVLGGDRAAPGSRDALASVGPRDPVRAAAAAYGLPLPADVRQDGANENVNGGGPPNPAQPRATPRNPAEPRATPSDPTAAAIARQGAVPDKYFSRRDPVAEVTGNEVVPPGTPGRLQAIRAWAFENLRGKSFRSDALNADVTVNRKGIEKPLSHGSDPILAAYTALPEMIRHGTLLASQRPYNVADRSTKAWHELAATVRVAGEDVPFSLTVREDAAGHYFYDLNSLRRGEGGEAAQQVGGIPSATGADTNRAATPKQDISGPDDSGKYSLRQNLTTALADSSEQPRAALRKMLDQALFPMRQGSQQAQVAAFKFANALRGIQYRYGQVDRQLTKQFTADDRSAMGRALDAQSVFEQSKPDAAARAAFDAGKTGLAGLADKQRATVETLNQLAQQTWQRLVDRKLVLPGAEGLPYYMPRQFVMMDGLTGARRITPEDNQIVAAGGKREGGTGGGGMTAMDPKGSNLSDRGPMERKHLTAEESSAAARAKFGDGVALVSDIRSLVDALSRQERAVAGRDLIDAIKRTGEAGGMDLVREGDLPGRGFFTLDHPSLWTVGPTGAEGPDGKPLFGRTPLHIAEEFRGPLDAVLSRPSPDWYKAIIAVKSKGMGAIMFSPFMHLMVEVGRSLPLFHGNPVALGKAIVRGGRMRNDPAAMDQAVKDGLAPIGSSFAQIDPVSVANEAGQFGSTSWARKLWDGDHAVGRAWHAMHQTLLWDQVGNLQNGIYADMRAKYVQAGFAPNTAGIMAAHLANRYAGALPPEHLSKFANMGANLTMFSRSFTLGNLGVMKDMLNGAPSHIRAAIEAELGPASQRPLMRRVVEGLQDAANVATAGQAFSLKNAPKDADAAQRYLMRKAIAAFALDIGLFYGLNAVAQAGFGIARNAGSMGLPAAAQKEWDDYVAGMGHGILPQSRNEPGKKDRIYIGQDSGGIGTYMRSPIGKVGEEFTGWLPILGHPGQMLLNKANPLLRAAWESVQGKDSLNRSIYNPHAEGIAEKMGVARDIALHFAKALVPADFVGQVYNFGTGVPGGDRRVALARIIGPLTGLASISQGNHEGPKAGFEQAAAERQAYARQMAVPEARKLVAAGKPDEARALLEQALGNPRDANAAMKPMLNPARVQVRRDAAFNRRADDAQRERAAGVTGGRGGSLGIADLVP